MICNFVLVLLFINFSVEGLQSLKLCQGPIFARRFINDIQIIKHFSSQYPRYSVWSYFLHSLKKCCWAPSLGHTAFAKYTIPLKAVYAPRKGDKRTVYNNDDFNGIGVVLRLLRISLAYNSYIRMGMSKNENERKGLVNNLFMMKRGTEKEFMADGNDCNNDSDKIDKEKGENGKYDENEKNENGVKKKKENDEEESDIFAETRFSEKDDEGLSDKENWNLRWKLLKKTQENTGKAKLKLLEVNAERYFDLMRTMRLHSEETGEVDLDRGVDEYRAMVKRQPGIIEDLVKMQQELESTRSDYEQERLEEDNKPEDDGSKKKSQLGPFVRRWKGLESREAAWNREKDDVNTKLEVWDAKKALLNTLSNVSGHYPIDAYWDLNQEEIGLLLKRVYLENERLHNDLDDALVMHDSITKLLTDLSKSTEVLPTQTKAMKAAYKEMLDLMHSAQQFILFQRSVLQSIRI